MEDDEKTKIRERESDQKNNTTKYSLEIKYSNNVKKTAEKTEGDCNKGWYLMEEEPQGADEEEEKWKVSAMKGNMFMSRSYNWAEIWQKHPPARWEIWKWICMAHTHIS